ncbi:hypothetical protein PRK78_007234 [Emydomyces testavorans]|uniref:DUF7582 domain-containing protein n=1 Tax=Emydomyces testavorans TaxID=2070801 RepID=A0AAF0DMU7_9EURO|nr:hypothetical protein PRK78_007234 [Emydomyces testavorans]
MRQKPPAIVTPARQVAPHVRAQSQPPGLAIRPVPGKIGDPHGLAKLQDHDSIDLTRDDLLDGLQHVADYLHAHGVYIEIYMVGGAVNTIHLRSRKYTHDVDFIAGPISTDKHFHLCKATQHAVKNSYAPFTKDWINNATERMPEVIGKVPRLIAEARAQNIVIFHVSGLKVLAAPWNYALVKKINRIISPLPKKYDINDAANYLNEYIKKNGNRPVHVRQIREWGRIYEAEVPDWALQKVNKEYSRYHRKQGIIFDNDGRGGGWQAGGRGGSGSRGQRGGRGGRGVGITLSRLFTKLKLH